MICYFSHDMIYFWEPEKSCRDPGPAGPRKRNHVATNPGRGRLDRVVTGFMFGEKSVASRDTSFHAKRNHVATGRPAGPRKRNHVATNPGPANGEKTCRDQSRAEMMEFYGIS